MPGRGETHTSRPLPVFNAWGVAKALSNQMERHPICLWFLPLAVWVLVRLITVSVDASNGLIQHLLPITAQPLSLEQ